MLAEAHFVAKRLVAYVIIRISLFQQHDIIRSTNSFCTVLQYFLQSKERWNDRTGQKVSEFERNHPYVYVDLETHTYMHTKKIQVNVCL